MADTKISALTAATAAAGANELAINEAGTSKKITVNQIADYLQNNLTGSSGAAGINRTTLCLTADSSGVTVVTQTTVMTLTGLGAGTWRVKGVLIWKTAATTTGIGITLNHTGTLTQFVSTWWTTTTGGTAATGVADQITSTAAGQLVEGKSERVKDTKTSFNAGTDTAGGTQLAIIEALMIVSVSGDIQLKIATSVAASAATLLAGSVLEIEKVA
jgi:hypothetical protein